MHWVMGHTEHHNINITSARWCCMCCCPCMEKMPDLWRVRYLKA